ncbi:MAG: extracellular solute-binding protein [Methylobacteriaceae bacterium]|nr:extracellular solute-binding protein [Methylobacteriaceae bacterium]
MTTTPTARLAAAAFFLVAGASAASAQSLNIYTYRQPELVKPVFDAFTAATGVKINTIFATAGLEERIRTEGAASPADLLLVEDIGRLQNAVDIGIARPVDSAVLGKAIPAHLRDPANLWFALTQRARVIYAAKARVADPPKTYEDLADPKWKGKICIRSGQHVYNVALFAAGVQHMGAEKAMGWLKGIKANLAKKPSGGDRDVAKDIAAGVCDIGLGNTYYMGGLLNEKDAAKRAWGEAVRVVLPTFRDGGTNMNISGAIVARHAPHKADAVRFLEFMVSPEAQRLYAEVNYEYPVVAGVPVEKTIASFGEPKPDNVPLAAIAGLRKQASELVDVVGFDN